MGEESNSARRVKEGDSLPFGNPCGKIAPHARSLEMISSRRVKNRFVARTSFRASFMRTFVIPTNLIIILDADTLT